MGSRVVMKLIKNFNLLRKSFSKIGPPLNATRKLRCATFFYPLPPLPGSLDVKAKSDIRQ